MITKIWIVKQLMSLLNKLISLPFCQRFLQTQRRTFSNYGPVKKMKIMKILKILNLFLPSLKNLVKYFILINNIIKIQMLQILKFIKMKEIIVNIWINYKTMRHLMQTLVWKLSLIELVIKIYNQKIKMVNKYKIMKLMITKWKKMNNKINMNMKLTKMMKQNYNNLLMKMINKWRMRIKMK